MDVVFRYKQGDEFAILMLETELPEAVALIERLQQELGTYKFPVPASPHSNDFVSLTLSTGIVKLDTSADTFETFTERAELSLRQAKQSVEPALSTMPKPYGSARSEHANKTLATTVRS